MSLLLPLISGAAIGCVYGLVAIGFSMIYRATGLVNFAQGDIMMLGAFLGYSLLLLPGTPLLVVLVVAAAVTGLFGLVLERFVFRPAVRRNASQIYLVLLTLGIGIVLSNSARLIWGANPVVYAVPEAHRTIDLLGYPLPVTYFYIWTTMAVLLAGLHLFFAHTWTGLAVRGVVDNKDVARTLGVDADLASAISFGIASAIGAAAGVLYAPLFYVSFDMGNIGVKAIAAAVLGGLGSIPGAVVGSLVIGWGETLGAAAIAPEYQDSIAFALMILILILLMRPMGLLGARPR